jgi:hypothetical protein
VGDDGAMDAVPLQYRTLTWWLNLIHESNPGIVQHMPFVSPCEMNDYQITYGAFDTLLSAVRLAGFNYKLTETTTRVIEERRDAEK